MWPGLAWRARALRLLAVAIPILSPLAAPAQLELLLRGAEPGKPRLGATGRYEFTSQEASGSRHLEFQAAVLDLGRRPSDSVVLRLWSGDSLEAQVEIAPALFEEGGSLLDHVRSVVEVRGGETKRLERQDWASFPGLDRVSPLESSRDSSLGWRDWDLAGRKVRTTGRRIQERSRTVRPLGEVTMTQIAERDLEIWTAASAPLFGIVRSEAVVRSQRQLSAPLPGVPESAPRVARYELRLLEILPETTRSQSKSR